MKKIIQSLHLKEKVIIENNVKDYVWKNKMINSHLGIALYENSIDVLDNLAAAKKDFVLLTNAPRPNATVINFLKKWT